MIRVTTLSAALLIASGAIAETTVQPVARAGVGTELDVIEFEQVSAISALVTYSNAEMLTSKTAEHHFQGDNGLDCVVYIVVGGGDQPETITVRCVNGWQAEPPEAQVADGEEIEIQINLALF